MYCDFPPDYHEGVQISPSCQISQKNSCILATYTKIWLMQLHVHTRKGMRKFLRKVLGKESLYKQMSQRYHAQQSIDFEVFVSRRDRKGTPHEA